jgi:oligoribonuclease NrnB/cAMP/cGMP phosphodiesterase (DHH superfamily)
MKQEHRVYEKIVTHSDFDGIVSASLCSFALCVNKVLFVGPSSIERSVISITGSDVVCDLPYPLECGLWFDHHEGNFQALQYRNIDPSVLPGRFELKPSCARVVLDFFGQTISFPAWYEETVAEADIIDSFNYCSIEEWRRETPGRIIDKTLKISDPTLRERNDYMRNLVFQIRDHPLEKVALLPEVRRRLARYEEEELRMTKIIQESAAFLPLDSRGEMVVLDLTGYKRRPDIVKNLAYLIFPEAFSVLEIHNLHDRGVKTNHLSFSLALSISLNQREHKKDVGEIMRSLNIGDGHRGAAGGTIYCTSKAQMLRKKGEIINEIFRLWEEQN